MSGLHLILVAACVLAGSGAPGLLAGREARWGERGGAVLLVLGSLLGLIGVFLPGEASLRMSWGLPWGEFAVGLDAIGRVFLLPVLLVPPLGAIYGLAYWGQREHPSNARGLRVFYGLMPAAMVLILLARDGAVFLITWEVMALAAFFMVTTEDDKAEARTAGWVYFVATHLGTLSLFAMFAVMHRVTGSLSMVRLEASVATPGIANAVFLLALLGFGLKAGLMPLHVWLPGAHATAPSHVSAVLSGVMLKMGIYGLVRMTALLPTPPPWWGAAVLCMGAVSAVLGLAFAIGQHDLKRVLAYSSIENMGIIAVGLGLALLGRAAGEPAWVALGLGGALFHVWSHSLFKPLLFFGAGSVLHGAGTRRIDHLGGLARRMPRTAGLFVVGAVAICALPPLNGFVGEMLIYLGLFRTLGAGGGLGWPAAAVPALALAGGLAVVAFTKLVGVVFLGEPRTEAAAHAHESSPGMLGPMVLLAALCVLLGGLPAIAAPLIDAAVGGWWTPRGAAAPSILAVSPLGWAPFLAAMLLALAGAAFLVLRRRVKPGSVSRPGTWDCGYAAPNARMQYTGSSFAQSLVALFAWGLWPRVRRMRPQGLFPTPASFASEVPDVVLDRLVLPTIRVLSDFLRWARVLQQGQIQVYVLYVLLTVIALFVSMYVG